MPLKSISFPFRVGPLWQETKTFLTESFVLNCSAVSPNWRYYSQEGSTSGTQLQVNVICNLMTLSRRCVCSHVSVSNSATMCWNILNELHLWHISSRTYSRKFMHHKKPAWPLLDLFPVLTTTIYFFNLEKYHHLKLSSTTRVT